MTNYTADPAPMVYNGRLYVYTSHDEDVTVSNFFTMNDWRLYSTADMVNWTDHGSRITARRWVTKASAGQAARRGQVNAFRVMATSTGMFRCNRRPEHRSLV